MRAERGFRAKPLIYVPYFSFHSERSDSGVKNLTQGKFCEKEGEGSQEMFHFVQHNTACQILRPDKKSEHAITLLTRKQIQNDRMIEKL